MAPRSHLILVDTTVWIDLFRGLRTPERRALETLLPQRRVVCVTDIVVTEILRGISSDREFAEVKYRLDSFPCLTARAPRTFIFAAELYRHCRKKGATIRSTVDCLIAAVCLENKTELLHHDADFKPLAKWCGLKIVDPSRILSLGQISS